MTRTLPTTACGQLVAMGDLIARGDGVAPANAHPVELWLASGDDAVRFVELVNAYRKLRRERAAAHKIDGTTPPADDEPIDHGPGLNEFEKLIDAAFGGTKVERFSIGTPPPPPGTPILCDGVDVTEAFAREIALKLDERDDGALVGLGRQLHQLGGIGYMQIAYYEFQRHVADRIEDRARLSIAWDNVGDWRH